MKRFTIFLSLLLLLGVETTAWAEIISPSSFKQTEVTSLDNLSADKQYIICLASNVTNKYLVDNEREENGAWLNDGNVGDRFSPIWKIEIQDAGGTKKYAFKNVSGNYVGTTFADNRIAPSTTAVYFEIIPGEGGFVFKNANGGENDGSYVSINPSYNWNTAYSTTTQTAWKIYEAETRDDVTSLDQLDNTKAYVIKSARGYMIYAPDYIATEAWCSGNGKYGYPTTTPIDESAANNQWAILTSPNTGKRYLYNIGAQQFLCDGGDNATFSITPDEASAFSLKTSRSVSWWGETTDTGTYPVVCVIGSDQINMGTNSNAEHAIVTNWNDEGDPGNAVYIKSVADIDPTAALAKIQ